MINEDEGRIVILLATSCGVVIDWKDKRRLVGTPSLY